MNILRILILGLTALTFMMIQPSDSTAGSKKKEGPDPDRRDMDIFKGDSKIGTTSYKWVTTDQGTTFASSTLEISTGGGKLFIRTHLKNNPDGKMDKYKKWIGRTGAKPTIIAFWKGNKIRVVSKGDKSFSKDLTVPGAGEFVVMDDFALHLYQDLGKRYLSAGITSFPALVAHEGRFDELKLKAAGNSSVSRKGETRALKVLDISSPDKTVRIHLAENGEIWAVEEGKLLAVRQGWTLGAVSQEAAAPVVVDEGKGGSEEPEEGEPAPEEKGPKPLPID